MRLILIAAVTFTLHSACNNVRNNIQEERKPLKLEAYLTDQISRVDSNWNQNDLYRDRASDRLRDTLPGLIDQGLLSDFPLQASTINEYKDGKYAVKFNGAYHKGTFDMSNPIYGIQFDVIGLTDEQTALSLKEDSFYTIEGKFNRFLRSDFKDYVGGMVNTPYFGFSKQTYPENTPEVSMGIILLDSVRTKPSKEPNGGHKY